ncbi:Origin recognition complex subunit 5 [Trinorchestia longiramus]|nr:Origin recognition complex subunit 5 [Trinorchestia longiramus]
MEALAPAREALPCRHDQIEALGRLIGEPGSPLPACIHVYGDSGSGKSTVLETVLACLSVKTCAANCVEMWSQQLLFQTAINSFADHVPASHNGYGAYSTCESLGEFVRQLQELGRRPGHEGDRLALVLYQCERLRDGDLFSLSALCRLQELCGGTVNICILLVSVLAIDKLLPSGGIAMPFVVHFPQYSKEELIELLLRERCPDEESEGFSEDFHRTYVTLVLSVFYPASRSQSEMRHLLSVHWKTYLGPVERGEVPAQQLRSDHLRTLWRNIEPHLRRALNTLYVKEVNSTQYCEMQQLLEQSSNKLPSVSTISGGAAKLSTLVSLRLVVQVGADEAIDAPKFKCAVGLHFIRQIARTVDFDVVHYLYDFA